MTTDVDTMPASRLIATGACSASCLLAVRDDTCTCRCNGQHHGILADTPVPAIEDWWVRADLCGWSTWLLDQSVLVCDRTPDVRTLARLDRQGLPAVCVVVRRGRHAVHVDQLHRWPDAGHERLWHELVVELLRQRRVDDPAFTSQLNGLTDPVEAQLVAALYCELWMGNPTGTQRALAALRGHPDPYVVAPTEATP